MSFPRWLRTWRRQLAITGATALHLDRLERWRERREVQRGASLIRVVYLHATPLSRAAALRRQLRWLHEQFRIIDFASFERSLASSVSPDPHQPSLLLTFDDGFASNYGVAAPILEDLGLRAVFFVVPAFSLRSGEAALRFCRDRVRQSRVEEAMTPEQIADLAGRGHTIGNHTFSHANLLKTSASEYEHEIIDSAAMIESWIGRPVDAFAWPFTWKAITPAAYRLAARRHRYCFAPCAGRTAAGVHAGSVIWRTNIETHASRAEWRFQCSRLADRAAAARRRHLSLVLAPAEVDAQPRLRRPA
jgi:peptidoglycan/xylan/chitin deacetylase (PgdA/CDA1 family)